MEQRLTSSCVLSDKDLEVGSIWRLSRCRDIIALRPLKLMAFRKEAYCYFKLMQMSLSDERLSFKISQLDKIVSINEWQSNSWEQMELFEHQINSDALPIRISFSVPSQACFAGLALKWKCGWKSHKHLCNLATIFNATASDLLTVVGWIVQRKLNHLSVKLTLTPSQDCLVPSESHSQAGMARLALE